MLEDIVPEIRSAQKVKVYSASPGYDSSSLGIHSQISFQPFITYLKNKSAGHSDTRARFYNYLVDRFQAEPALLDPITDSRVLDEHRDLLELLGTVLFPVVSEAEKNLFTFSVPYQFSVFHDSPSFRNLFVEEDRFLLPENASIDYLKQVQCALLYSHAMEKFYGVQLNVNTDLVYPVTDPATGMRKYYKLRYDRRFIDMHLAGKLPDIHDCAVCLNTFRILDLEKQLETMPPKLFRAEGFGVWIAEDVTTQEALDSIKKILLRKESCDTGIFNELKTNIQALVGLNDIEVGLTPFVKLNNEFVMDETCLHHGLMSRHWKANDPESESFFRACIGFLTEMPEPMPVPVMDETIVEMAPFLKSLWDQGLRSYLSYPVQDNDGLIGLLELASPEPNALNHDVMTRIEPVMPLISLALLKNRESFVDRIEKMIKEKFTALQPSVEWKFAQVAWEYMCNRDHNQGNVVFEGVYPLFGSVDVRNSSLERRKAIQKDLVVQLELADGVIGEIQSAMPLPLLEGLQFKIHNFRQAIATDLQAEDEIRITDFLANEFQPVLQHLNKNNPSLSKAIDNYMAEVNAADGHLHRHRKDYEVTLARINEAVLEYLDKEEEVLQISYPHYFEKYRTDGVEYSIYIGQSIAPNYPFDILYLKNIRLWQLKSMAEVARITHKLLPSLKVPLQTTQLLLIHSQPISISFRRDERRFDVEGSYNVRYEIIKKRLDKVHIRGTSERLTQPGMIAMVYSNPREATEYQEYIQFLQSRAILGPVVENLELEELQGVSGLKAIRVKVELGGS